MLTARRLDDWFTLAVGVLVTCAASQSVNQPNLTVGNGSSAHAYHAHLAWTERDQGDGVRGLNDFRAGEAMYFPLRHPRAVTIYMTGVHVDLDLAFIRGGRIVKVTRAPACWVETVQKPCPTYPSPGTVDAVLEVPFGTLPGRALGQRVQGEALSVR